ncbi:MAG: DUF2807 domain-containing protein [Thermoleophilia bacterium]|nr:DUF2807 domain-containing protein [Thermoleophilia bacterium]
MSSCTMDRSHRAGLILAVAMLALAAVACGSDDDRGRVSGSGVVVSESRDVEEFDEIVVSDFGQVVVEVTGAETLEVEADDNLLPLLTSSVSDGRLELGVRSNTRLDPSSDVVYRVTAADLRALTVLGSGSASASGIDTAELTASIAGAGSMKLDGRAQAIELRIPGAGNIDAAKLVASVGSVHINGAGDVTVNATDTLDIAINGSGNVSYLGTPVLEQSINGSGKISGIEARSSG